MPGTIISEGPSYLICDRRNLAVLQETLGLLPVEIRDADGLDESLLDEVLHSLPGVEVVDVLEDLLAVGPGREQLLALLQGEGPVDEVQVQVVQAEVRQGPAEGGFDGAAAMAVRPELAGDVEVLALHDAFSDLRGDRLADFFLVAVTVRAVEMAVADVDGVFHGLGHLAGF